MSGAAFDPSIIANAGQIGQQNSPNALLQGYAATAGNLLNLQKLQADRAAGQDFQASIDPATGQPVVSKLNRLLAADPRAAFDAIDASQAGQQNQSTQLANQQQQIANSLKRIQVEGDLATNYAQNPPSRKEVLSDLTGLIQDGVVDPSTAAQMASDPPFDAPLSVQQAYWKNHAATYAAAAGAVGRFLPQPSPVNAGGQTVLTDTNPLSPTFTAPGSTITNSPSAEFMSAPHTITLPDGSSFTGTPAQIVQRLGGSIPPASVNPPAGAGEAPAGFGAQNLPVVGRPAGAAPSAAPAAPLAAAQPAGPAPAPAAPGGGIVVPAGAGAAATALATDQMGAFSQDVQTAANSAPTMSSIYELGAAARGFKPGPLAANLAEANSIFAELGLPAATDSASAEQTAAKAAGLIMASNLTPFGQATDEKLGAALGITPNGSMSAEGLAATAAMTAGAKLYQLRLGQAAQQWKASGGNPADSNQGYDAFKLKFQSKTSPLVLALPYMPPQQIKDLQAYVKTLPGDQQRLINQQVQYAAQQGWLNAAGSAQQ